MRALAATVTLLAVAVACTDLGGLSSTSGPEMPDASATDAAAIDAGVVAADASADAARFCERAPTDAGTVLFCRDFDDGTRADFDWDLTTIDSDAGVSLDPDNVSPPSSLRSRLEARATACDYARVGKTIASTADTLRFAFDVKLGGVDVDKTSGVYFAALALSSGATDCHLTLRASDTSGQLAEQVGNITTNHAMVRWPVPGTWSRVELSLRRSTAMVDVAVDGKPALASPVSVSPSCTIDPQQIQLQLGVYCGGGPTSPQEVRFDDVLVTAP